MKQMKHLKEYFNNFETSELKSLFDKLYQDDWKVSEENLVDSFGVEWNFRDIDHFVYFSRQVFSTVVAGYKIFLELLEDKSSDESSENIKEKLESANSKIMLLEEQNSIFKKELDIKGKELRDLKTSLKLQKPSKTEIPVEAHKPKASTKEYISLRRRKYVKIV
jgi:hypothetical protein